MISDDEDSSCGVPALKPRNGDDWDSDSSCSDDDVHMPRLSEPRYCDWDSSDDEVEIWDDRKLFQCLTNVFDEDWTDECPDELGCASYEKQQFPDDQRLLNHPNMWIADTAASTHMSSHKAGMKNVRHAKQQMSMGDKTTVSSALIGDVKGTIHDKYGNSLNRVTLTDIAHMNTGFNLCSLTKLMSQGWKLNGDEDAIWVTKGEMTLKFDIKITTKKGMIFAAYIKQEVAAASVGENVKMNVDYKVAHDMLGHFGIEATKKSAENLGWTITGESRDSCEGCAVAKAKQASLPQVSLTEPLKEGERRVHLDISTLKKKKKDDENRPMTSKPNWRLIVEPDSGMAFTEFFATKKGMIEPTCAKFQQWKESGKPVTHLRMDNAGENLKLIERCKSADWKLGIKKFELTARDTPQQNSAAEVKFPAISGRAHAMMYRSNVPYNMKLLVIGKAIETATKLDGLILVDDRGKQVTRYEKFGMEKPDWAKSLRV